MGIPKASVLPVPVRACPIMSVPVRAMGIAMAWMGKGVVMPTCSRALLIAVKTPSSPKVVAAVEATSAGSASVVRVVALVVGIQRAGCMGAAVSGARGSCPLAV